MDLTAAQIKDKIYLQSLIDNLQQQREESLRQNEINKNNNLRLLRQTNALNGLNGGVEESSYARLLSGYNKGAASINAEFNPQLALAQAYLAQASRAGGGGRGRRRRRSDEDPYDLTTFNAQRVPHQNESYIHRKPTGRKIGLLDQKF